MPIQALQWIDFRLWPVCRNEYNSAQKPPISLGCGHSICQCCLFLLSKQQCPFHQANILIDIKKLPINFALLSLVGGKVVEDIDVDVQDVKEHERVQSSTGSYRELGSVLTEYSQNKSFYEW